ncbi:MAG: TolC family protein [Candidatus Gastranaerophilales bacterium]|nr:TolC family protein [Candidatus Gastranaerophilales bacterium]
MKKVFVILSIIMIIISSPVYAKKEKSPAENNIEYMNIHWWEKYNDEYLTNNLIKLYEKNYDLKNAELKVKENEQAVKMQFSNELPQLGFSGQLYRDMRSSMQKYGDLIIPSYAQYNYYLPITASYEVDIWGLNRFKTKSAREHLEIVKQAERAAYISLTSDFATDYFNLIRTDELLLLQNQLIKTQEEIVSKVKDKYETGLCTITDLLAEQRLLTALKEERNSYAYTGETLINSLRVYLSDSEENIERNKYSDVSVPQNIPSEYNTAIIENRPDYLQDEANIKRIGFDVKAAKREFLPNFIIFGQIGLNAYHLDSLFNSASQMFSAGVIPSLDLFTGGRKIAMLKIKKFEYEEALNSYQKTILTGIKDINSCLAEYKETLENLDESENRLKLQDKTYSLIKDKYEIGTANNLDVLYAKEALLMVKKEETVNKINAVISTIGLYKAAGGIDLYLINEDI